ncbi:MAG: Flp pilus assembly complex ATPase component TadA [Candidatus Sungbacteria bacterium]|uniref:Flp pilus assembly complex ATPase component TadA n=2 Tax=Candidatus Sungiibacteriota bacterium TaxID=2750080 RepID=A0A9D6DQJ1_9BACT|nr:Flp pilus assembly complex ATPase component TadA [Candidatus Sungbacteria bacterium]
MSEKLLAYLIDNGFLKEDQIKNLPPQVLADVIQLESELVKLNLVKPLDILKAKSAVLGVPYLNLANKNIPAEVLHQIPEDAVLHYKILPVQKNGNELTIGMVNPEDVEASEALKFIAIKNNFIPKVHVISDSDFDAISKQYRNLGREVTSALEELEEELVSGGRSGAGANLEKVEQITAEAPITKVVAVILRHAVEGKASDIHIEPLGNETRVRFRLDGTLHSSIVLPQEVHNAIISRIKVLSNLKIDETRVPQDGRFHTKIGSSKIDFRVSTLPTAFGEKIALRILDPTVGVGTFADLGLIGRNMEIYEKSIKNPYGIVLITGPTGSGKSTTLYTTLNFLNKEGVNIITLEDPVEYYIPGVNQSQIHPEIGFTFASGLRSILRQDPNIIMVGEIRDKETAGLATHAALTGHLVFSTLHTNDSLGIIPRLVDMEIDPFLIPSTLVAGMAQRLIKKMCKECSKPIPLPEKFSKVINDALKDMPEVEHQKYGLKKPWHLFEAPGCAACGFKGTKGRVGIFEIFEVTPSLEKIILGSAISETAIAEEARRQGMITMKQDGIIKALTGLVSIEEVLRVVEE